MAKEIYLNRMDREQKELASRLCKVCKINLPLYCYSGTNNTGSVCDKCKENNNENKN